MSSTPTLSAELTGLSRGKPQTRDITEQLGRQWWTSQSAPQSGSWVGPSPAQHKIAGGSRVLRRQANKSFLPPPALLLLTSTV